jgi:invasion protein IalB
MPIDMNSTTVRAGLGAVLLLIGLAAGWFAHKAVNGAPDIAMISVYDDWRLACPPTTQPDGTCEMQQDVLDAKTHNELARLSIFRLKGDNTLIVTVPFNVLLEPGLALGFGNDKPLVYPYETCNGVGCIARLKFDDTLRAALSKTTQARVLFAGLDGKPVGLPFSVKGFNAAAAAFDSAEARRHSWWRRLWS